MVLYIAYRVGLWDWCGLLGCECATALVDVTFRILYEGVFLLFPLLLLLEGMTVVVWGRLWLLV